MNEVILLESRTLREEFCIPENLVILDRVGSLITLSESGFATTEQIAAFYQVSIETIKQIVKRHRDELEKDGYRVLTRKEFTQIYAGFPHSQSRYIAIFPRRAVLRIGMLLAESEVAKQVRHYLIAAENHSLSVSDRQSLITMAEQLQTQAVNIAANARRSSENAEQLISQANIIKAMVQEMYRDREQVRQVQDEVRHIRNKVDKLDLHFSTWENTSQIFDSEDFISEEQIEILRAKVKQIPGKAVSIWKKFNKHFSITRYKFLPAKNFDEALAWLASYIPT